MFSQFVDWLNLNDWLLLFRLFREFAELLKFFKFLLFSDFHGFANLVENHNDEEENTAVKPAFFLDHCDFYIFLELTQNIH